MNGLIYKPVIATILLSVIFSGCMSEENKQQSNSASAMDTVVKNLRCEYLVNPLGIDVTEPRLSWILESGRRAQVQTAYRILVSTSEGQLKENKADLWDSGKVETDQSNQVVYKGKPLQPRMSCCWKVRVWDKDGKASDWSEPAMWTAGLLKPDDWKAKWIGYDVQASGTDVDDEKMKMLSLDGSKWVWFGEGDPRKSDQVGRRYFRRQIESDSDKTIKSALFRLAANNELILYLNGIRMHRIPGLKPTETVDFKGRIKAGDNILAIESTNENDATNHAVIAGKLLIEYETGEAVVVPVDGSWKASDIRQENWQRPDFDDADWKSAQEIASVGDQPWGKPSEDKMILPPPPYLRKTFSLERSIRRATVYASALGLYELQINGKRVGKDYFTPGWTDYPTRVYYQTYDVTGLINEGENAIGAILADGWYAGYVGFGRKRELYGSEPRLLVQLEVEYTNGERQTVISDKSWKAAYGPLLEADFLMGETYDSRKEMPGWDSPGFDDSAWDSVDITNTIESKLQAYPSVTVQKILEIKPIKLSEPRKNVYVFDLGQNFAGWARLNVEGRAGTKVVLRFAEILNPDGTIYSENLRAARCTDTYILKGDGREIWEPRFTFHGFRYIEITGFPEKPPIDAITGVVVHSNTPQTGSFDCSIPMVNQLYSNIVWSQRSNFIEVPTDCPQRDERLGWTGDAQIFVRTSTYNMDVAAFFTKWLVDLEDAQSEEGAFPDVAPRKVAMGDGTAAWGDAGTICPWTIYEVYGDKRALEKHYDSMKKWISYLQKNSEGLLRPAEGYGDWVSIASDTPKDVIATAYFAYSTNLVSKAAAALGKNDEAEKYRKLYEQIKEAFNKAYVTEDARIKGETQTCYVLGLHFDLLPKEKRAPATEHLIEAIKNKNWHLSTGFVGLSYLLPILTETGNLDIAYRLLTNDTFPSWGYSIKNGATSIWERWDGWTEDKGFQNPGMNSFNHYSFGAVGRWLFGTVGGIDTDGPGYKKILIRPQPGKITSAKTSYESINGTIATDWKIEDKNFKLNVTIPANTTATVYIPAPNAQSITENGLPAKDAESVRFLRMEQKCAVFTVGSGQYWFSSKLP